jgi:NADPH:quinone reductase-like Zn-dependent oxidoreductase
VTRSGHQEASAALNCAVEANAIKPMIDKAFGFGEVHAAYRHMAAGAHFGKTVISIA